MKYSSILIFSGREAEYGGYACWDWHKRAEDLPEVG